MAKYVRSLDPDNNVRIRALALERGLMRNAIEMGTLECKCPEAVEGEHECRAEEYRTTFEERAKQREKAAREQINEAILLQIAQNKTTKAINSFLFSTDAISKGWINGWTNY